MIGDSAAIPIEHPEFTLSLEAYQYDFTLHRQAKDRADEVGLMIEAGQYTGSEAVAIIARAYLDLLERRGLPPHLKCYPSIQLASGAYFDFLDPDSTPVSPEDLASALSKIARCNGHTLGHLAVSVAQHCVLASRAAPEGFKFEALMHDAAEAVTGDITTPLKQLLADFKIVEKRCEHAIRRQYFLPLEMSPEVKEVDIRMACTEKRDVMPKDPPGEGWDLLKGVKPYDIIIEPWEPEVAKQRWLLAFNKLWPEHMARVQIRNANAAAAEIFKDVPLHPRIAEARSQQDFKREHLGEFTDVPEPTRKQRIAHGLAFNDPIQQRNEDRNNK